MWLSYIVCPFLSISMCAYGTRYMEHVHHNRLKLATILYDPAHISPLRHVKKKRLGRLGTLDLGQKRSEQNAECGTMARAHNWIRAKPRSRTNSKLNIWHNRTWKLRFCSMFNIGSMCAPGGMNQIKGRHLLDPPLLFCRSRALVQKHKISAILCLKYSKWSL